MSFLYSIQLINLIWVKHVSVCHAVDDIWSIFWSNNFITNANSKIAH